MMSKTRRNKRLSYSTAIAIPFVAILLATLLTLPLSCGKKEAGEIKVGAALPLTGDGAVYGDAARKALDLAAEEINSAGGINGRKISIVYEDTQLKPRPATNAVMKLITVDKVSVIIGPMASNCVLPVAPIVNENRVILISPSATSHELTTEGGEYVFRTIVSDIYDGTAMAQYSHNQLGHRKVGVFYVDEAGPKGVTEAFVTEFEQLGGEVIASEAGTQEGVDFRSQISKLKSANPDAVYFAGYAKETVIFLRQAKELKLSKQLMTHQLIDDPDVISRAGDAANGVIFTTPKLTPETGGAAVKAFFDKFIAKYGEEPQNFAPNAYDALMLVAESIKNSGVESIGIKRSLHKIKDYEGASGTMTIDDNGDVIQKMNVMIISDGRPIPAGG